ncbi:hypothetical protein ACFGVR_16675 [Mucilaginibacter sp. AW1-3]
MYTAFNLLKATELALMRKGFWRPWYELTDGQYAYGKLSYEGFFRRTALVETANTNYRITYEGFFSRTLIISSNGELIGKLKIGLFSKASLMMHDGFEAELSRDSVWKRGYVWNTNRFGEIMKLTEALFSYKKVLTITVDPNSVNLDVFPLLCFLGSHLIILRRNQRQAAS